MKYIRTKDGVYEVNEVIVRNKKMYELSNVDNFISEEKLKKIIIAQADTIEELCDEFVREFNYRNHRYRGIYESLKDIFEENNTINMTYENDIEIYGAIWTDKGLKYVAKMNDKGELELI